jgi:PPE-repeat protein
MALPPEVHSALLSAGPGPGSLLAAAAAWSSLSAEYASAADELTAALSAVQAGSWDGPSAEQYVAAHEPYLIWLMQASANCAATAAQQGTAAAAYVSALSAMPTLVELSANHVAHAALTATNFFGINTIPIAVNEADYARMWIQAATTMTTYQAVSSTSLAAAPSTAPAPKVLRSASSTDVTSSAASTPPDPSNSFFIDLWYFLIGAWRDAGMNFGGPPSTWLYQTYLGLFVYLPEALANAHTPAQIFAVLLSELSQFIFWRLVELLELIQFLPQLIPQLLTVALPLTTAAVGAVVGLGAASGLAGLAGLAGLPSGVATLPVPAVAPVSTPLTVANPVAAAPAPGSAPMSAPIHLPAPAAAPAAGGPPPPTGPAGFPYIAGGLDMRSAATDEAKARDPQSKALSAPGSAVAGAAAREQGVARRRRRSGMRGHRNEFMDMNFEVKPDWSAPPSAQAAMSAASHDGAAPLRLVDTTAREAPARAAGLTTLTSNAFGGGPTVPMLPNTWDVSNDIGPDPT